MMTTREQNFMSMARSSANVFPKWNDLWSAIPVVNREVTALNEEIGKIDAVSEQTTLITKGVTEDKYNARDEALSAIVNVAKPAAVYAQDMGNMELHRQLNQSRGVLAGLAQNELLNTLSAIYTQVTNVKEEIADYGVSEEKLQDAKAKLDAFAAAIPSTRDAIVERKTSNEIISESIVNLRRIFYRLDNLMKLFDGTGFYREYKNARVIIDLGSRKKPAVEEELPSANE